MLVDADAIRKIDSCTVNFKNHLQYNNRLKYSQIKSSSRFSFFTVGETMVLKNLTRMTF